MEDGLSQETCLKLRRDLYELFVDRECDYLPGLLFLCLPAHPLSSFRSNYVSVIKADLSQVM